MKKLNSGVCALCACVFAMLMLVGCPQANGGSNRGGENPTTQIVRSAHMEVQGCEQGLKITLRNVRDAGIEVFDGNERIPVVLSNFDDIAYFPFTENGKQYRVKLHGEDTTTHHMVDNESVTCKALGGNKFEDCIDLSKLWSSSVEGRYDPAEDKYYFRLRNTQINNPSDVIKNADFLNTQFEYILCLGDNYHNEWVSGDVIWFNDRDLESSGAFGNRLKQESEIRVNNWRNNDPITEDEKLRFGYQYYFHIRLKIAYSHAGANYHGEFFADLNNSPVYSFGNTPNNVLATPKLELVTDSGSGRVDYHRENDNPNGNPVENWVHTWSPSHKGGSISLTDNTFAIANSDSTKTIDWASYDTITFYMRFGSEFGQNMNIYAEGQNSSGDNFSYDLSGGIALDDYGEPQLIKVFVEDITRFKNRYNITDDSLKIVLRSKDNADFRVISMKFDRYPQAAENLIFDPADYGDDEEVSGDGQFVYIDNGHEVTSGGTKYLKVTTSNRGHDDGGYMTYDSTVTLPSAIDVDPGYMRLKAECFVLDSQHTETTNNDGYFGFCFWIPMWHDEDDVGGTFLQNPNFNTKDNYFTSGDIVMYGTDLTPEAMQNGFSFDSFNFWANTSGREDIDFTDLAGKTFYIGRIWAYGGRGN